MPVKSVKRSNQKESTICMNLQKEYERKYGRKTVVLSQIGSFFEMYGLHVIEDENTTVYGRADEFAELLNISLAVKSKTNVRKEDLFKEEDDNDSSDCDSVVDSDDEECFKTQSKEVLKMIVMAGVPIYQLHRHVKIFLKHDFTVVLYEQVTSKPNITRKITEIITPGTYIENINSIDSPGVGSLYIEEDIDFNTTQKIITFGLSYIDTSTGKNQIYKIMSPNNDTRNLFDDLNKWASNFKPKEWIVNCNLNKPELIDLVKRTFESYSSKCEFMSYNDNTLLKISYIEEFLDKLFTNKSMISPIENIGLERNNEVLFSYILLLRYIYERNPSIINKISKPEWWTQSRFMSMYNQAHMQLQIIPVNKDYYSKSINSLYDVLQVCCTSMGRRMLKFRLLNPLIDRYTIMMRYYWISFFYKNEKEDSSIYESYRDDLKSIVDIERCNRKLVVKRLHPREFAALDTSYHMILRLYEKLNDNEGWIRFKKDMDLDMVFQNEIIAYIDYYKRIFDINKMKQLNLNNLTNFFKNGVSSELDKLEQQQQDLLDKIKDIKNGIVEIIENDKKDLTLSRGFNIDKVVNVEFTDRDGWFVTINKKMIDDQAKPGQQNTFLNKICEKYKLTTKHKSKMSYRLTSTQIKNISDSLVVIKDKIKTVVKHLYFEKLQFLAETYYELWDQMVCFVSNIDFFTSGAYIADKYGYIKPNLVDKHNGKSFVSTTGIRHPIIERINDSIEYIKNDVDIGTSDVKGILLYGVNGVGKSSLGKSIGLNICMAQMGYFVSATTFDYFPFIKMFTRITSEDNIFQGHSSFVVEMNDLRTILNNMDNRSLIIGDEICRGTEHMSGLSIVAATIEDFMKKKASFILATHQHSLIDIDLMKEQINKGLGVYHLDISFDQNNETFTYGRKIKPGRGENLYGLEVARYVLNNDEFYQNSLNIRRELTHDTHEIVVPKKSTYNADLYMHCCQICGKTEKDSPLDAHHIIFQREFSDKSQRDGIVKNKKSNLVVLCKEHHNMIHNGNLRVSGYDFTSNGKKLKFCYIEDSGSNVSYDFENAISIPDKHVSKKKYTDDDVKKVQEFYDYYDNNGMKSTICELRKVGFDKISAGTVKKMMAGQY